MNLSTYLLLIFFAISLSICSGEETLGESNFNTGGFPGSNSPDAAVKNETINVKDFPEIEITLAEGKKILSCNLDLAVNIYVCPNGGNPILAKWSVFGFSALGRNLEDGTAKIFGIASVKSNSKILFEEKIFVELPGVGSYGSFQNIPVNSTTDFFREYRKNGQKLAA